MLNAKSRTSSNSKINKNSRLSAQEINNQLSRKLKLVKSQMRVNHPNANSIGQTLYSGHGKPAQFLDSRRQSILNSQYNKRKINLLTITKQNRKIYQRINTQTSNYSTKALNKSYDSINSATSRISRKSNKSKCTSSRKGSRMQVKSQRQRVLEVRNINAVGQEQLDGFAKMFTNHQSHLPPKAPKQTKMQQPQQQIQTPFRHIFEVHQVQQQYENMQKNPKQKQPSTKKWKLSSGKKPQHLHLTPDRFVKQSQQTVPVLPMIRESTPHGSSKLSQIIDQLGYKYRY